MSVLIHSLLVILLVSVVILLVSKYLMSSSNEKFTLYTTDTITSADKTYMNYLLNSIVNKINERMNRKFVLLGIDRLKKENTKFVSTFFALDKSDDSTHKLLVSFILDNNSVIINEVREGYSLEYVLPRVPISSRGSTLYKPKQNVDPDDANDKTSLDSTEIKEMRGVHVSALELNRDLPHLEAVKLKNMNYVPFASRKNKFEWDTNGVNLMEECQDTTRGSYHGRVRPKIYPNNIPSMFKSRNTDDDYYWMFDLGQDSSSRPIGT